MPPMGTDFEAEGLLQGVEGEERDARRDLLAELEQNGVSLEEMKQAVAEGRLALLPVEQVLAGKGPRYTREEVAEKSGLGLDFLRRQWRALGMPEPEPGDRYFTARDVEAAQRVKQLKDLDIPEEELLQVSRVIGMNMSQLAAASRGLGVRVFSSPGDTEAEVGRRFATIVEGLAPLLTPSLEYVLQLHLREQIRHDVFGQREITEGADPAAEQAFAFADLVGFTKLGEELDLAELSEMTDRLGEMAAEVAVGPVRLVKLIGDAAMLSSNDPCELMRATIELVRLAADEGEGFPHLRAGVTFGEAIPRGGDFYGRPVNLASRITDRARPDSVLCDEAAHEAAGEELFTYSFAGAKNLKGIDAEVRLFRARLKNGATGS